MERHSSMTCKTFTVKIQKSKCSKKQLDELEKIFLEQKWYKNYILNWCEQSEENKITKFNTKQNNITKKDKDMNDVDIRIELLSVSQRQCLVSRMYSNIKTLHTLKSKGLQKPGRLKFSKKETVIELKQYGTTHKIISSKRVKIQGIHKSLYVNGLEQFTNIPKIEICNARLLNLPTGYYVQFVCYIPKQIKQKIQKTIGIDFGCSTDFTTSEGEKIEAKVQESERLKNFKEI